LPVLFLIVVPLATIVSLYGHGLEEQAKSSPDSASVHVGKGYEFVQSERYAEASREFQAALALDPRLLQVRYQLAICFFALGQREESRREFERLSEETPGEPSVRYYLGRLDLLEDALDSAIHHLESLAPAPPFPDTAYYLGSAYLKKGNLEKASHWLQKATEATPRDFRVHDHLARAFLKAGRRADAEKEYALSAELRGGYNEAARQALTCSHELETRPLEEARVTCRSLFDPNDPDKLTTLGMLFGQHGDYLEAIEPLQQAAQLDPESFEIHHNLGLTYFRLRRYAEARAPLEKATGLRPEFFGSNALLGATLFALGDDERAYEIAGRAHGLNPQDADTAALLFKVTVLLAQRSFERKEYSLCLRRLLEASELRPGEAEIHRRLAEVYRLLGQSNQAERETQEARRLGGIGLQ
jgi:protein O-GlcNAc transferase